MRRLLALSALLFALGFWCLSQQGHAQSTMPLMGVGLGGPSGGAAAPTWVPGTGAYRNVNYGLSGATWTGLNSGTNYPSGALVVVATENPDGVVFTTPTIGGVAMTVAANDAGNRCQLLYAALSSGGVDTFAIANSIAYGTVGVAAGYLTGVSSSPSSPVNEAYAANADPQTTSSSLTVPSTGFGIVELGSDNVNMPVTPTWNVGTGDVNASLSTKGQILLGHLTTSGTPSVSGSAPGYSFAACMAGAAWGP